ncbi:SpoIIE family protein phosphatase [Proteobacteria bacterium 005FR1]|nr:SpoIIE family protein phosphatase [Proteobacteria bacterium 005FR1]
MIEFWLKEYADRLLVRDEASLSRIRQCVRDEAQRTGLSPESVEELAIVATELARNQLRHAGGGRMVCRTCRRGEAEAIELLAADNGKGLNDFTASVQDDRKPSRTEGSMGEGLASVLRLSDEVHVDTRENEGTLFTVLKYRDRPKTFGYESAIMTAPHPDEQKSGDSALFVETESGFFAVVVDGVGHGAEARKAANRAVAFLRSRTDQALDTLIESCDRELRDTRGAALMLARYDRRSRQLETAGAGDIFGELHCASESARHFSVSQRSLGVVGAETRWHIVIDKLEVSAGSVLVLHSDGLKSRLELHEHRNLLRKHPAIIAEHLLKHCSRGTDDASALVVRFANRL